MASFCSGCGFPLGENVTFCSNCGARNTTAGPTVQPASAAPVATKGGSGFKILLVVIGFFVVAGVVAVGALLYIGHRVKEAVVEKAHDYGVQLPSQSSSESASAQNARVYHACDLLSKDEAARLLGQPIDHIQTQDDACLYLGPPGLTVKLAKEQAANAFQSAQGPGAKVDAARTATAFDQLLNSVAGANGQGATGGEMPMMMLIIGRDGKAQMSAVTMGKALFKGLGEASGTPAPAFADDIPGLGDRAVRLPKLGLNVLKGDILIRIIPGPLPDADARTIEVARTVLPRI